MDRQPNTDRWTNNGLTARHTTTIHNASTACCWHKNET